jgi:hypothetical protein
VTSAVGLARYSPLMVEQTSDSSNVSVVVIAVGLLGASLAALFTFTQILDRFFPAAEPVEFGQTQDHIAERFGVVCPYLSTWDRAMTPGNDDGRTFTSPTGDAVEWRCFGSWSPTVFGGGALGETQRTIDWALDNGAEILEDKYVGAYEMSGSFS